ncbi:MAG: aspartate 1-decarboxylase [Armatimonadetes bacterium]|nr:aspartate 1-decarboxylase [Armatimonadota bacterium]
MLRTMLKSKITPATVTESQLDYEGSITIDEDIMEAADLLPNEQVHVLNINTGARILTYAIPGERGSGVICLNGPAARTGLVGDQVTVLSYVQVAEEEVQGWERALVQLNGENRIVP